MPGFDPCLFPGAHIHESCYIDSPCEIGEGTSIWHFSHVMRNSVIGRNCNLGQNVVVSPQVTLGDNVKVQNNVSIYTGVVLEDDVFCGPSMVFTNVINPRSEIVRRGEYKTTLVKKGATFGANCTVVCGVTVGRHAFVGAGAVVTRDVPDYALIVGVPGRQRGWACRCGDSLPIPDPSRDREGAVSGGAGPGKPLPDGRGSDEADSGNPAHIICGSCGNEYVLRGDRLAPHRETQEER